MRKTPLHQQLLRSLKSSAFSRAPLMNWREHQIWGNLEESLQRVREGRDPFVQRDKRERR
jgi:hypothetical protein